MILKELEKKSYLLAIYIHLIAANPRAFFQNMKAYMDPNFFNNWDDFIEMNNILMEVSALPHISDPAKGTYQRLSTAFKALGFDGVSNQKMLLDYETSLNEQHAHELQKEKDERYLNTVANPMLITFNKEYERLKKISATDTRLPLLEKTYLGLQATFNKLLQNLNQLQKGPSKHRMKKSAALKNRFERDMKFHLACLLKRPEMDEHRHWGTAFVKSILNFITCAAGVGIVYRVATGHWLFNTASRTKAKVGHASDELTARAARRKRVAPNRSS